jgi:hypothetical protein
MGFVVWAKEHNADAVNVNATMARHLVRHDGKGFSRVIRTATKMRKTTYSINAKVFTGLQCADRIRFSTFSKRAN